LSPVRPPFFPSPHTNAFTFTTAPNFRVTLVQTDGQPPKCTLIERRDLRAPFNEAVSFVEEDARGAFTGILSRGEGAAVVRVESVAVSKVWWGRLGDLT